MALFLFTLCAIVLTLIYFFFKIRYGYWEKMGVPFEPPLPVFGNMKGIGRTVHFRDINQRIYNKFKDVTPMAGMFTFFTKTALVIDLDLIKHILIKDFSNFHDRNLFNNVKDDPLTGHLVTLEGEQWRAMRNKLSPVFTGSRMRYMFPTVTSVAQNLAKVCGELSAQSAESDLEIKEVCARYTTDVIGTCAFGLECNSLNNPNAEFRNKGRSFIEKPRHSLLVLAFIVSNPNFARKLHMKFIADDVSEFFMRSVRETIDYRVKNNIKRNDFMDMMIEMRAKDEAAAKANNGIDLSQGLTFEQIAAQAFVFFIAGFDTSSSTMSLCLYELAKNAKVQEKLRKEIVDVLAKHNNELTYDAMKEMTYLDQVIAETLRMYPVLPQLVRKCMSDFRIPGTDFIIEKNLQVIIPIHAIHHDPDLFPNPKKFDPDRFTAEACLKRHPMAYLPFGEGPRNCIGMRFGKMQTKIGLIMLLKDYKFSKSSLTDDPIQIAKKSFIISAENGIHLKVERL